MQDSLEKLTKIQIVPSFWKSLPETPGIYIYYKNSQIIYIGKAINLKRRVASYFSLNLESKTARMISEATHISYIQVSSELEALLLEARLIRNYMPHYNIAAKDDKHPLYITITNDKFPRVITTRKSGTYGPFPSSVNVKSVLRLIRRIFPFSDHKISKRACLYSHIGLCLPCPNVATDNSIYLKNIRNIKKILDGKVNLLRKDLEKTMLVYSKLQNYEEAIAIRNQISQLEYITRPQMPTDFYMENPNLYEDVRKKETDELAGLLKNLKLKIKNCTRIECFDIAHLAGTNATASMVTFINGEADKSEYRHFKIRQKKSQSDFDSMEEVAMRRLKHFNDWSKPDLIIVDGSVGQVNKFNKIIKNIPIVGIAKHPDRLIVGDKKIVLTGDPLNLVSRMRDEAHRFARRLHHSLIKRAIIN